MIKAQNSIRLPAFSINWQNREQRPRTAVSFCQLVARMRFLLAKPATFRVAVFGLIHATLVACGGCAWLSKNNHGPMDESRWFMGQARVAIQQGNKAQACSLLQDCVRRNPDDIEAQRWLGELLVELGRSDEAAEHLASVANTSPDDPAALVQFARVWIQQGSPDQARPILQRAIGIDPHHVEALLMLAEIESKREEAALARWQMVVAENPNQPVPPELQGRGTALGLYYRALEIDRESVFAQFGIARTHLRQKEPDRASPMLRALTHRNDLTPTQVADAKWLLGVAYGAHHRWIDAAKSLEAAVGQNPVVGSDVWYRIAYAYHQGGDLLNAERVADIALKRNPTDTNAKTLWAALQQSGSSSPNTGHIIQASHTQLAVPDGW